MKRTLMAVGGHADDIEFSCGGALLKYRDQGYEVAYVMATNNMSGSVSEMGPEGKPVVVARPGPEEMMRLRKAEAEAGAACFGATPIHLDHPQRHYWGPDGTQVELRYGCERPPCVPPDVPSILTAHECEASRRRLADLILEHDPEWVLTHGMADKDMEHFGVALLVTKSYWDAVERGHEGGLAHWRSGHSYLGHINTLWDMAVDTSGYLEKKFAALRNHRSQVPDTERPGFFTREWAHTCGSACGCETAEVFMVVNRGKATELK